VQHHFRKVHHNTFKVQQNLLIPAANYKSTSPFWKSASQYVQSTAEPSHPSSKSQKYITILEKCITKQ
ncbi:hypothetical protein AB5N96_10010, partial [Chryseomicrobium imtechense]